MIVTLTTDFGTADGYVAAMKGTALGIAPDVRLIDVTHEIPPQDVMEAAWVLRQSAWTFPQGTIHLAVVDPGVGTSRRPLAARFRPAGSDREHLFVGPDNGLLSLISDGPPSRAVVLDRPEFWRSSRTSRTFHGRDVFAPVAAYLAQDTQLRDLGSVTETTATLRWPLPIADASGVEGSILHVDRYGNCVTNIQRETVEAHRADRAVKVYAGSTIIRGLSETYAHAAAAEPLALFGSTGALEVSVNKGNAARLLSLSRGLPVRLIFETRSERVRRLAGAV
ncbi:MAG: SAM-dependent chlorinase/fluorinase [Bacteroidota bacterium]